MTAVADLHVYVHWPFCVSKCPYCDFNSHVAGHVDQPRWRRALMAELADAAVRLPGRTVGSVFFGGGTPSLMAPDTVAAVLDAVAAHWTTAADLEVTLEANPSSAERAGLPALRQAGVNRLSMGVQSFDDDVLRFLGRAHDAAAARAAIDAAARTFTRFSFDMIYAWRGQSRAHWRRELETALALAAGHLSLYQLTIEPGTAFHRDGVHVAGEDAAADLYEMTQDTLEAAGLPAYEISNHAAPGAGCRHNLAVWRGDDYVGIGPGAHGRVTVGGETQAVRRTPAPERWLALVERQGHGTAACEPLTPAERGEELILLGLRLSKGADRRRLRRLVGFDPVEGFDPATLSRLREAGLLTCTDRTLRITRRGRLRLDAILAALLAG